MTKIVTCAAPIAAALFKTGLTSLFKPAAIFSVALLALIEINSPLRAMETAPTPPSGPAAQAILRWFTTDRSLGCEGQQENDSACTVGSNMAGSEVFYGDSTGDGPQADALAFVYYWDGAGGNGTHLVVAYFHRDGSNYRFIKTFPDIGDFAKTPKSLVKGTTVRFLPGKARFSMVVLGGRDAACCPTGRANYTITLNPFALPTTYHAPQTEPELALANVIRLAVSVGLRSALTTGTGQYATLFTPQLSHAVAEADLKLVQLNCAGDRTQGVCGLGYDPLTCAQDTPPAPILYRTISVKESNEAIIGYAWGTGNTDQGRYRLVKVDGTWKLDGIECPAAAGDKYNMSQRVRARNKK